MSVPDEQKPSAVSSETRHIHTVDDLKALSRATKKLILAVLCFALFLDTFNNSSLFAAIPTISIELNIANSQSPWLLSAYQLTFAALLLIAGRVSDLYNPKWVFVLGSSGMGLFALISGFLRSKVPLIVCRALMGAGGALTIPSAMNILVHMYSDPEEQAAAITTFGGMGAVGIVLGLIIGALFVSFATWPWVFFFSTIVSAVITSAFIFLVPNIHQESSKEPSEKLRRLHRLDIVGVGIFAATLILFIFAVTSGSIDGWGSATVIAPLVISPALAVGFFMWEAKLPELNAALPPKVWRYENFTILIIISLVPFTWWGSIFPLFSWIWEIVYGWSPINVAAHFLPIALGIFPALALSGLLQSKYRLKWVIMLGFVLLITGTALLPFANEKDRYWRFAFPGFLLGTAGAALIYTTSNIALLRATPSTVSGIVSAVFMVSLQTGAATGVALVTSIQTSVQIEHGGPNGFQGRAAGIWFLVAVIGTIALCAMVFIKDSVGPVASQSLVQEQGVDAIA